MLGFAEVFHVGLAEQCEWADNAQEHAATMMDAHPEAESDKTRTKIGKTRAPLRWQYDAMTSGGDA